jgi:hypothetical protein
MNIRAAIKHCATAGAVLGTVAIYAEPAAAQVRWGRAGAPREGACFFRDANFQNDYFCVRAGEQIADLPEGMNDQISSIRTFGDVEVTVYQNRDFDGRARRFANDVGNLQNQGWNDRLSSIRVDSRLVGTTGVYGYDDRRATRQDANRIIERAYWDVLGRAPDAQGLRDYRRRMINDGWTEADVRRALRSSPERQDQRFNRTRSRAEDTVRQAYLSVLNREPDPASEIYVRKMLDDGWTYEDIVRDLRNSPEYRNRTGRR